MLRVNVRLRPFPTASQKPGPIASRQFRMGSGRPQPRPSWTVTERPTRAGVGRSGKRSLRRWAPRVGATQGQPITRVGLVAGLLDADYSASQMSYDLRRLRLHRLIEKIPGTNTYRTTSEGIRAAVFYTKVRDRLLGPLLDAGYQPPARRLPTTGTRGASPRPDHDRPGPHRLHRRRPPERVDSHARISRVPRGLAETLGGGWRREMRPGEGASRPWRVNGGLSARTRTSSGLRSLPAFRALLA